MGGGLVFALGMMLGAVLPGSLLALRQWRARARRRALVGLIVAPALLEAKARGHDEIRTEHVLIALLEDPDVTEAVGSRIDIEALRARVDGEVGYAGPPLQKKLRRSKEAVRWIAYANVRRPRGVPSAMDLLFVVYERMDATSTPRRYLEEAGLTFDVLSRPARATATASSDATPYRRPPTAGDCSVCFWNDSQTQTPFVMEMLTSELGKSGPAARYLTSRIHYRGSAVVGSFPRQEAERIVERITRRARAAGFPLRVTIV